MTPDPTVLVAAPTAFEVWATLVIPAITGVGTLVLATASLVIAGRAHRLASDVAQTEYEAGLAEERKALGKELRLWLKHRSRARSDEKYATIAEIVRHRVIRALKSSPVADSDLLLLIIVVITDDEERAAKESPELLGAYDTALLLAVEEWVTQEGFLRDMAPVIASLMRGLDIDPAPKVGDLVLKAAARLESLNG